MFHEIKRSGFMNRSILIALAVCCPVVGAFASDCARTSVGRTPINDLGAGLYLGQFQGGLYPGGSNTCPPGHAAAGLSKAALVVPRSADGTPSPAGRMVMLSIGMSNTTQEFCGGAFPTCQPFSFIGQAAATPLVNHSTLRIVDGAMGGQTPPTWDSPTDANYNIVRDTRLAPAGLTEQQVQALWIKQANPGPMVSLPNAGADAFVLQAGVANVIRAAKVRYPNLQLVYLSSRIYAGYASTTLNPEPYAYETGFSVKWLVQAQIAQRAGGGVDPVAGNLDFAVAPWIGWGPYLWADGTTPRSDGLTWLCSDYNTDGTHPNTGARTKVGTMLLNFLLAEPTAATWFLAPGTPPCAADFNGSGVLSVQDIFDFLAALHARSATADFNHSGTLTVQDLFDFLAAYFAGC